MAYEDREVSGGLDGDDGFGDLGAGAGKNTRSNGLRGGLGDATPLGPVPPRSRDDATYRDDLQLDLSGAGPGAGTKVTAGPTPPPSSFAARVVAEPTRKEGKLGEIYTQKMMVVNAAEAPKGTRFDWTYGTVRETPRPAGKADVEGPESTFPYQFRNAGPEKLSGVVTYGPTARPNADAAGALADLTVPKPKILRSELESEAEGKRRPVTDTVLLGEDLVVTIELSSIDPNAIDDAANAYAMIPGLRYVKTRVASPGVYEVVLHTERVGPIDGAITVLPFDTSVNQMPQLPLPKLGVAPPDSRKTPDSRPVDVEGAKKWLQSDYKNLMDERKLGNDALTRQTEINDPPPKTPMWLNILLGVATAALGGATAMIGMRISQRLVDKAAEELAEGVKVFFESAMASTVTTVLAGLGGDPSEKSGKRAPHVRFLMATESALNTAARELEQQELVNRVNPEIDRMEKKDPGSGFRAALELHEALLTEIPKAKEIQFHSSFVQWVNFVTRGQLGTMNDKDPNAPTDMSTQTSTAPEGRGPATIQSTPGVIALIVGGLEVHKPEKPVHIRRSYMHGINTGLREEVSKYKIRDMPFALTVRGDAPGRYDGAYAFARNEQGMIWLDDEKHEYLEKKSGSTAMAGARKILDEEIGDQKITPDA